SDFFLLTDMGQFAIRLVSSSDQNATARDAASAALYNVAAGTEITIVAGLGRFNANFQIMLFNADQLTIGAVGTPEELGAAAFEQVALPAESAEVTANLTLPTTGYFGLTIEWSSSVPDSISNAGVVTRKASDV